MKLPAFAYHRAESLADAVAVLDENGPEARVLAGGQSLLPLMALRLSAPEVLVDVTAAADLGAHRTDEAGLTAGAAVTARAVELDEATHPLVRAALGHVGHPEIRNRGTVCGALAHADPAAEMPALLLALDGTVTVAGADGQRSVAAADFVTGPYSTDLADGELLARVTLPAPAPGAGWSVREIARRAGDFALAGVVALVDLDAESRCADVRVALFGVAARAVRAAGAEQVLTGAVATPDVLREAAAHAFDDVAVLGDIHGSATYRRRAGARLVERCLAEAAVRCSSTHPEVTRA